jgi:hypothetical protein
LLVAAARMLQVRGLFGVGVGVGRGVTVVVGIGVGVAVTDGVAVGEGTGVGDGVTAHAGCRPPRQRAATAKTATSFFLAPLI